jgi:hypothetical protein
MLARSLKPILYARGGVAPLFDYDYLFGAVSTKSLAAQEKAHAELLRQAVPSDCDDGHERRKLPCSPSESKGRQDELRGK